MTAPVSPPQPTAEPVRQHTPTPWHIRPEGTIQGAPADGERYGDMVTTYNGLAHPRTRGIANADLIVEAVNSHASLKARAEQAEQAVYLLESNAREQAKLLADTGRRVEELERTLRIAREAVWSGGDTLKAITVIDKALPQSSGVARAEK